MSFSLFYIIIKALQSISSFFVHWYIDGFHWFFHQFTNNLELLDRTFAFKITLRNLFKPLYGDYTILGRFFGIIFRPLRLLIGGITYLFVGIFFLALFIVWILVPLYLILRVFTG